MLQVEKTILDRFKALLASRVNVYKLILFGSRARGDAAPDSDLDVFVVVEHATSDIERYISDCAWLVRQPQSSNRLSPRRIIKIIKMTLISGKVWPITCRRLIED